MQSLWTNSTQVPSFRSFSGEQKTDVLIIGGGIAGILCAHMLQKSGIRCILVEAGRICGGITKDTTAKITAQHGLIYHKLLRQLGKERAQLYLNANLTAVEQYRKLAKDIPCEFETKANCIYATHTTDRLDLEMEALSALGYNAHYRQQLPLPFSVAGAIEFPTQAQFHPLTFLGALATDLNIFEHTAIRKIENGIATTDYGRIRAKKIIVATHFPFLNKRGFYFLKLYQQRSYVLALEDAQQVDGMYLDAEENGLSFRNAGNLLLLGGGGHRTGHQGGSWPVLEDFARVHYPNAKSMYRWAAQDCMSLDGLPYAGHYSPNTPNLYVVTGFNKWGMTNAMVSATLLRDQILGRPNALSELFAPSRSIWTPQLFVNGLESTWNLLRFSKPRCTHLGCALRWNPQEHTWDCPCHGSRFTEHGHLIDNPATKNLKHP